MNQLEREVKDMIYLWETKKLTNHIMEKYFIKWREKFNAEDEKCLKDK